MHDFESIERRLRATRLADDATSLIGAAATIAAGIRHGDLARWQAAVNTLPQIHGCIAQLDQDCVEVATERVLPESTRETIRTALRLLCPWRKGPYSICGVDIDTEWRSDWKWQRVAPHLSPLSGRRVLDVGCGSGYHVWRMLGAGADVVIGIDPGLLFNLQFNAIQHFINHNSSAVLPLKLEQLPPMGCFDTVFSMGVLYHRRHPQEHLQELQQAMAPGAELVLETLVMPPEGPPVLQPRERYARMRNVWQIPTSAALCQWLKECGLQDIRLVSEGYTTTAEQRSTNWMQFESLAQSLHADNAQLTVEGYPAPRRAVVIAQSPA